MKKLTIGILISIISIINVTPVLGQDDGYDMPAYLNDLESLNPRDGSALGFLESAERKDYFTLASDAYAAGDYENSARFYLARIRDTYDNISMYNLACCYSLMGEKKLAARALEYAAENGFAMLELVEGDPDFEAIRDSAGFKEAVVKIAANAEAQANDGNGRRYFELTSLAPGTVILPDDYDPDVAYPVLVALHGGAHTPDRVLALRDMCDGTDFIFVALRAQNPTLWEGQVGYNWVHYGVEELDVQIHSSELAEQYILNSIETIKQQYKTGGVYLVGFSDGGAMSYITGIRNPDIIDGIILMAGYYPNQLIDEEDLAAGSKLRIFIVHGTADTSIAYEQMEESLTMLCGAGYDTELFAHDGDHILHEEGMKAAQAWFGF